MPRFDKTGPEGKGPMTGRGMGKCDTSVEVPKNEKKKERETTIGRGRGGQGRGMGPHNQGKK